MVVQFMTLVGKCYYFFMVSGFITFVVKLITFMVCIIFMVGITFMVSITFMGDTSVVQ